MHINVSGKDITEFFTIMWSADRTYGNTLSLSIFLPCSGFLHPIFHNQTLFIISPTALFYALMNPH